MSAFYKELKDENFSHKTNPKKVLFLQYETNPVDLSYDGATSGTAKCGLELFKYLNSFDEYTCTYIGATGQSDGSEEFSSKYYDIVVFNNLSFTEVLSIDFKKLQETNPKIKSVLICHSLGYEHMNEYKVKMFNMVDHVVCIGKISYDTFYDTIEDKSKYSMIANPIDISSYENLDFSQERQNKIMILYHPWKGNIDVFAKEVFLLIKEQIPDALLTICSPKYFYGLIDEIKAQCRNTDGVKFAGSLNKRKLIEELLTSKCVFADTLHAENTPYSVIEASMCGCVVLHDYGKNCGTNNVNSDYYKIKFNAPSIDNRKEYANYVVQQLCNYNEYKADLEFERNYVMTKFRKENILPLWKNIFDKL